ncbi:MAG: glycosyltransferase family 2 protein [Actinomycetota bacterium]|nr:glycosyltransferase family 2 protein [Actinomycetota bacterium]
MVTGLRMTERARPRSLSVVIPVYNEEEILENTVETIVTGIRGLDLDRFEILLCENGSRDSTPALAARLSAEIPEVEVIVLERPNYGAAMRAGFFAARGDAIVNFDADYYDLDFLAAALDTEGDIVVAAKGILGSHDARVLSRRIVSRCFGWFVRSLLDVSVTETHGMKLFRRAAIAPLLPNVFRTKDLFDTELLARAEYRGCTITELPVETKELRHSRSGIVRRIPRTVWGLLRLRFYLRLARSTRATPLPAAAADNAVDVAV